MSAMNDWLPIPLPDDIKELTHLLEMEEKYGDRHNAKIMRRKLNRITKMGQ